jgi:hypothetical protein
MTGRVVRIGSGAGFADDRIEPAVELVEKGHIDYLVFECLAERTIALATLERLSEPDLGYNEWLYDRMDAVLDGCARQGIKIITNMGAANPEAAAKLVAELARDKGLELTVAAVTGDDVLDRIQGTQLPLLERPGTLDSLGDTIVSANAYLGWEPIVEALRAGADIVITGRVADPSLYMAPLIHEFGWAGDDWDLMGTAASVGHLLECTGHVTGGYFADPGYKDVPDLATLGFPIAEVSENGDYVITKVEGSGGRVTVRTCTEQLLYEVHDPANYPSADVVADFSKAWFTEDGYDRIAVHGITGRARPDTMKVSVGYSDGFIGEGQISYAGINSLARGKLALEVIERRLALIGVDTSETRFELIGTNAVHRGAGVAETPGTGEVRIRAVGRTATLHEARRLGHEVTALWLNGPAGGGGATRNAYPVIAILSVFLDRTLVQTRVEIVTADR